MTNSASQATRAPLNIARGLSRRSIEILLLLGIHTTTEEKSGGSWVQQARLNFGRLGAVAADKWRLVYAATACTFSSMFPSMTLRARGERKSTPCRVAFVTAGYLRQQQPLLTYQA